MGLPVTGDFAELIQTECIFVINCLIPVSDVLSLDININASTLGTPGGQERRQDIQSAMEALEKGQATTNKSCTSSNPKVEILELYQQFYRWTNGLWCYWQGSYCLLLAHKIISPLILTRALYQHPGSHNKIRHPMNKASRSLDDVHNSIAQLFCTEQGLGCSTL